MPQRLISDPLFSYLDQQSHLHSIRTGRCLRLIMSRVGPVPAAVTGTVLPPMAAGSLQGTQRSLFKLGNPVALSTVEEDSLIDTHWQSC